MTQSSPIHLPLVREAARRPASGKRDTTLVLLERYLSEQPALTAVERFAKLHDLGGLPSERRYQALLPVRPPRSGEQYAFRVDLDACTGCKACVVACHNLNGLCSEEAETWRSVGLLHGGSAAEPIQQTVTTACHHCVDPACLKGCPVNAYEKDPTTGIVKHLDDQCIGCQYCTLTCPYEVPRFSKKRGIVRKCDMCSDRLLAGEAPACVQGCPNEAISIQVVDQGQALEDAAADGFLPGTPSPSITVPTTSYVSRRALPRNMLPADFFRVRSGHHHVPLVVMLVLTQLAVGTFCFGVLLAELGLIQWLGPEQGHAGLLAACAGVLALAASTLHLGRPLYAFRAVLGFRRSWLSREILAFGAFAALSLFHAAVLSPFPESWRKAGAAGAAQLASGTGKIGVVVGLLAVFCSVMVYHATRRELWSVARSAARFFGSTLILGISTTLAVSLLTAKVSGAESIHAVWRWLAQALGAIVIAKLCWEASVLFHVKHKRFSELKRSALLLSGELRRLFSGRLAFGFSGAILLGALTASDSMTGGIVALALASWAALLVGELLERLLFFRAASGPSMPGGYQ